MLEEKKKNHKKISQIWPPSLSSPKTYDKNSSVIFALYVKKSSFFPPLFFNCGIVKKMATYK